MDENLRDKSEEFLIPNEFNKNLDMILQQGIIYGPSQRFIFDSLGIKLIREPVLEDYED